MARSDANFIQLAGLTMGNSNSGKLLTVMPGYEC